MTFARIRPPGGWTDNSVIDDGEIEALDNNQSKAIDGTGGGAYAPSAAIEVGGQGLGVPGPFVSSGTHDVTGETTLAGVVEQFTPQAQNFPHRTADPGGNNAFIDIAHGLSTELWIAVGALSTGPRLLTSPDGHNWTVQASGESQNLRCVAANSSIAVCDGGSGEVRSSTDGATWTARTLPTSVLTYALHWFAGASLFIAGHDSGDISTSPDGITWTARTVPAGFATKTFIRFASKSSGGNLIVGIVSGSYDKCITSTDGITWTERTLAEAIDAKGVCWSPDQGKWFIVGASGKVQHSADGITWTAANVTSPVTFDAQDVAAHGRLVVVVHKVSNGRFRTYYSLDGATWRFGAELDGASGADPRIAYVPGRNRFAVCCETYVHFSLAIGDGGV